MHTGTRQALVALAAVAAAAVFVWAICTAGAPLAAWDAFAH
jgi:hypothetical protein